MASKNVFQAGRTLNERTGFVDGVDCWELTILECFLGSFLAEGLSDSCNAM